jgi:hypothetical protein
MCLHVWRINGEGLLFQKYRRAVRDGASDEEIHVQLNDANTSHDVVIWMQLVEELRGKTINSVQHAAVEAELERFGARQNRNTIQRRLCRLIKSLCRLPILSQLCRALVAPGRDRH